MHKQAKIIIKNLAVLPGWLMRVSLNSFLIGLDGEKFVVVLLQGLLEASEQK